MVRVPAVAVATPVAFSSARPRANTYPSQLDRRTMSRTLSLPVASYAPAPSYAPTPRSESRAPAATKSSSSSWRILCYGDSLTAGFHDNGRQFSPYGNALREALVSMGVQCDVSICGLSGLRTDQMLAQISSPVVKAKFGTFGKGLAHMLDNDQRYDLVILMAGTNDFTPNSNLQAIQNRVSELHRVCHNRGVPTMMLAAPCNTHNLRVGLSKILQAWANSESDVKAFIDPEELIPRRQSSYWEPDQCHFTPAGSRTLGTQLAPTVAKVLQQLGERECPEAPVRPTLARGTSLANLAHVQPTPRSQAYTKVTSTCVPFPVAQLARPARIARGGA